MSSVGAVLYHDYNENEEDYNPSRPSIGSVASIVRVTERKLVIYSKSEHTAFCFLYVVVAYIIFGNVFSFSLNHEF